MSSDTKSNKNNILVSSNFDTGNIELEKISYNEKDVNVDVKIRKDVRNFVALSLSISLSLSLSQFLSLSLKDM